MRHYAHDFVTRWATAPRVSAAVLVALLTAPVAADELEWHQQALIVELPDQLGYYSHVDSDCPIEASTVSTTIEGVLIRSRIKPIADSYSDAEHFFVEINVYCADMDKANEVIFETDVRFGVVANNTDMVINWDYGSLDFGDASDINATVRRDVEDALTDYLKANLSAGDDNTATKSGYDIEGTRL